MKMRDLFGLGVRLFGIWLICRGLAYVASFLDMKLYPATEKAQYSAAALLIYATVDFSMAAVFLIWTRVIVVWSYGEEGGQAGDTDSIAGSEPEGPDRPA